MRGGRRVRRTLGDRPHRQGLLNAADYLDTCAHSSAAAGKKISKQTWFIVPGIDDFDRAEVDSDRVVETHPELCFRAMAPDALGRPMRIVT